MHLQVPTTNVLALASDQGLAAAAIELCFPFSPLHSIASGRRHSPTASHGTAPSHPFAQPAIATNSRNAAPTPASRLLNAASLVSHAVAAVAKSRRKADVSVHHKNSRFSVSKVSGDAVGNRSLIIQVQPSAQPRAAHHASRHGHFERMDVAASDLRASTLWLLLDLAPSPFPAVEPSFLAAGALTPGAASLQQQVQSESGSVVTGPMPFPRLAAVLQAETVAALSVVGRLFTGAADAYLSSILLSEGMPGVVARSRCVPGEWPAMSLPATCVELRIEAPKPEVDSHNDSTVLNEAPSLQSLLQAVSEIALVWAMSESAASATQYNGAAAFRRSGGGPTLAQQAETLDINASTASPRLALLLLFIAYQVGRMGPGFPPLVLVSRNANGAGSSSTLPAAVRLATLYLCSPAPAGKRVPTGSAGSGNAVALSDSSWVLHDGVVDMLLSFSTRSVCVSVAIDS